MREQSIYFLQALWDVDVQRTKLEKVAREASQCEIDQMLMGVLDKRTVWISDRAKELRRKIDVIKSDINSVNRPNQLVAVNKNVEQLIGEIRALQIKTARTLDADSGPMTEDLHIIVRQLFPFALKKIKEQTYYQMYRLMVLNGGLPETNFYFPTSDLLEEWVYFYKNKLIPMFEQIDEKSLDGRWAYEKKKVTLNGKTKIEQFVSVKPEKDELECVVGKPEIGTGVKGNLRIYGRGHITNLSPFDLMKNINPSYRTSLYHVKDYSLLEDENSNPLFALEKILRREKYLMAPEVYFEYVNKYIIANTFYHRIQLGNCIYCGSPLYHDKCPKCGG